MSQKGTYLVLTFTGGSQPPANPADRTNPIMLERRRVNLAHKNQLGRPGHAVGDSPRRRN